MIAAETIIDRARQGTMLKNSEATVGCLKNDIFSCSSNDQINAVENQAEFKEENKKHPGAPMEPRSLIMRDMTPQNEYYSSPVYWTDFSMWQTVHPDLQKVNPWSVENNFHPAARECAYFSEPRVQYMPYKMITAGYPHDFQLQEFQYFVVMDFEATCDKERVLHPQEIIEFPSVLVNAFTGQLEDSFQIYVRPAYHQHLTDFCKELTGIQQIQVDRGVPLSEALLKHDKWLGDKGIKHTNFVIVTWGDWDCRVMLESECKFKRIRKPPYFNRWINLKVPFKEYFGARCNLKDAVNMAGLSWEGRPHCGLDDARNTARILTLMMRNGFRFSVTNSLVQHLAGHHAACPPSAVGVPIMKTQFEKMANPAHSGSSPPINSILKERCIHCFCGAPSKKAMKRQQGPNQGRYFFGCGNWTTTRGPLCSFFKWAS